MASSGRTPVSSADPNKKRKVVHFDWHYIRSFPGTLKLAMSVVSLMGFICVQSIPLATDLTEGGLYKFLSGFYKFVSMIGFWLPLKLLILYIFHIVEKVNYIPWLLSEVIFAGVWSAFFFICGCAAASYGKLDPGWIAGAFFAFAAMFLFGLYALRSYRKWKANEPAQLPSLNRNTATRSSAPPSLALY